MENSASCEINRLVYVAVGVAALGGLLFGYDTGVISGAIIFVKSQFSLSAIMEEIVVSSVLGGAMAGAILGGALTNRFGRRKLIILSGIIFTASALGTALAPTVDWLIVGRIVSGVAIGIASFISPMYISELAPAKVRGALVSVNMLAIATGIVAAYLADYALSGSQQWRTMFGLAAIPSVALVLGMWPLPDSPRWLISRSEDAEATRALRRLRSAPDIGPEMADIKRSMDQPRGNRATELFEPALRMPLIVGLGLAVFQQITGINTVMYYSPTIFKFAGITGTGPAILAGAGLAAVMWCFYALAILLLDRAGRRPLLLIGIAGQAVGLAILGAAFQLHEIARLKSEIAIAGLAIYVAAFAIGLGPVFWLLISEIYPLKSRGAAMSAVTVTNWGMNMAVAVTFLTLVERIGRAGTFWMYGIIAVGAWFFCFCLVPETKGKTLEQIEAQWRQGESPRKP
jgi:sugar porter (SP) family MFS transporter